jgi:hypothetical protein
LDQHYGKRRKERDDHGQRPTPFRNAERWENLDGPIENRTFVMPGAFLANSQLYGHGIAMPLHACATYLQIITNNSVQEIRAGSF